MIDEVLYNSPALHALKRHQLMSLSKRYGLKASGKNADMIGRLRDYASTRSPDNTVMLPLPAATPAPGSRMDLDMLQSASPCPTPSNISPLKDVTNERRESGLSDKWEVLSVSGASLISPAKHQGGMTKSSSVSSWKSARNGEPLSEFGVCEEQHQSGTRSKSSKSSSIKTIASSLSRRASLASQHLMSRSTSATSNLTMTAADTQSSNSLPAETLEEQSQPFPPSPASTVGIPRRYSRISLLERPSTIRLVSPEPAPTGGSADVLPFFSPAQVKERRSMAPLRGSQIPQAPVAAIVTRKSMPAMSSAGSGAPAAMFANVYPPLPVDVPPVPPIPGAYKVAQPSPARTNRMTITNAQFEDAGKQVLAAMEAKMRATLGDRGAAFGEELLKGKNAEVNKLVNVNEGLGEGGWGLRNMASSSSIQDRYAAAHQREFAKMKSIDGEKSTSSLSRKASFSKASSAASSSSKTTFNWGATTTIKEDEPPRTPGKRKLSISALTMPSAPNGASLTDNGERQAKRSRLSPGPNALGSLKTAGRSLVNLIGEATTPARKKRRSSLKSGRGIVQRFGLFRGKNLGSLSRPTASSAARSPISRSAATPSFTASTSALNLSVQGPSTVASSTSSRSILATDGRTAKDRARSTSAQSTISTTSRAAIRPRLPDFGDAPSLPRSGSINGLSQSKPLSSSVASHLSMRKQSQADLIRTARPAPAPPAAPLSMPAAAGDLGASTPAAKRASTLFKPTASSLARMQATVRPGTERSLSSTPSTSQVKPFGTASTRANVEGEAMPNSIATPHQLKSALKATPTASPARTPGKAHSSSALRARQKASGLSAVKSKGNLRAEKEVDARRAAIRARQQRIGEERELRQMLGGVPGAPGLRAEDHETS